MCVPLVEGGVDAGRFGFLDADLRRIEVEREPDAKMARAAERGMVHVCVIEADDVPANPGTGGPSETVGTATVILDTGPKCECLDRAVFRTQVQAVVEIGGDDSVAYRRVRGSYSNGTWVSNDGALSLGVGKLRIECVLSDGSNAELAERRRDESEVETGALAIPHRDSVEVGVSCEILYGRTRGQE